MDLSHAQQIFFNQIRSKMPAHFSFVDEVAELLNISNDSAYRRIRGEKPLGLDEIHVLCAKYQVSIDQILGVNSNTVIFSYDKVDHLYFGFIKYLEYLANMLELFTKLGNVKMYFYSKDIPPYLFTPFPELMAFKFFFWKRTLMGYPELARQQFEGAVTDQETATLAKKINLLYTKIPSVDIWNGESINATLSQLDFYRQTNIFPDKDVLLKVYSQLEELVSHLELQAEKGIKLSYDKPELLTNVAYDVYINETLIGDNTVFAQSDTRQITFINHSGINLMSTEDPGFGDVTFKHIQNVIRKSVHISVAGEKERSVFFNKLREKIYLQKKNVN